jgi:hypothetical protein
VVKQLAQAADSTTSTRRPAGFRRNFKNRKDNKMNAPIDNTAIAEAARRAVIDSLTRSERNAEAAPEVKELDETIARRPTFRSVRLLIAV